MPITLGMILSFATAAAVHGEFNRANVGEHAFARYAELFVARHGRAARLGRCSRTSNRGWAPAGHPRLRACAA